MIPGFPLDGGRVLRSILWGSTGSLMKATNAAAIVGRLFGWAFIAYGLFLVLGGNWLGGIWIAFIGWFLSSAADASRKELTLREHLSGIKVKDVMNTQPGGIGPETTVEQVVANIFQRLHGRAVPVCDNDKLLGIVTIDDVKKLPREQWSATPVARIMTREPLYTVSPEDGLHNAFKMIAQHAINQVLVTSDGKCIGMLSRADIIAHLTLRTRSSFNDTTASTTTGMPMTKVGTARTSPGRLPRARTTVLVLPVWLSDARSCPSACSG
jgi:CBS domain-containing protein